MRHVRQLALAVAAVALVSTAALQADIRMQEKSQTKFEGLLGRMAGLFGGKAVKEGVVSTVAIKGARMARFSDTSGEIIDLNEERVYTLDMRNKTYSVQTFAEIRQQFEEMSRKAQSETPRAKEAREPSQGPEMEVEVRSKNTGQQRTINGFDCHQVITTITVHEKGKSLEQAGGLVVTLDGWIGPALPAMKEVAEFNLRYMKAIQSPAMAEDAAQMAQALVMYPGLKEALTRIEADKIKLDGTPIMTTITFQSVPNPQQAAKAQEEQPAGGGLGGLMGRLARKKPAEGAAAPAAADAPKGATTFMTTIHEVLSATPAASDADVAIPAGFKQKR